MRISVMIFNSSIMKSPRIHKYLEKPCLEYTSIYEFHQYTLIVSMLDHHGCEL